MACLALASLFSSLSAQQTTPPSTSDSAGQTQPQPSGQGQTTPPAQSSDKTPDQNPGQDQEKKDQDKKDPQNLSGQGKVAGTSNDRLFYALPNFLSLQNGDKLPPLSVKDKFKVVALGTFDPINYPWWGIISAIDQAANSERGYGQGWIGYAKRYGATAGDSTIENFMVGAIFPSILRQDPRFYYSEKGGVLRRTEYAVSRIFVTRGDSGKKQFNFSEIFGAAVAAGISTNAYHPKGTYISTPSNPHLFVPSDRTLSNTFTVWGTQVGLDTITLVIKEFWPDIHRKVANRHRPEAAAAATPAPTP